MFLVTFLILFCVLNFGSTHHCPSTLEHWNEIRTVLDYKHCNHTDPRCLISNVLQRYHTNDVYKRLMKDGCEDGSFPAFPTLGQFIAEEPVIKLLIANSTRGQNHVMSLHNFQQISTLALSVANNLNRFVCRRIKDINQVYAVLGSKQRHLDIQRFVSLTIRRYNPTQTKDDLIAHSNRLTCLNVDMLEYEVRQAFHSEHEHTEHKGKRHDAFRSEVVQFGDNVNVGKIIIDYPSNSQIGKTLESDHLDGVNQKNTPKVPTTSSITKRANRLDKTRNSQPKFKHPKHNHDTHSHHLNQQTGSTISQEEASDLDMKLASTTQPSHYAHRTNTPRDHHNRLSIPYHHKSPIERHEIFMRQKIDSLSSVLVSAILRGINIYPDRRSCMVDHLDYIMTHYGNYRKILNETGLENLKRDIEKESSCDGNKIASSQENKHGTHSSHSSYNRKHETSCRMKQAVPDYFVSVESTGYHLHFDKLLTSKDILNLKTRDGNHLTRAQFLDVCPSILYSLVQKTQKKVPPTEQSTQLQSSTLETYGLSTLSVLIISLCSLLGAVFVKCTKKLIKDYAMGMMLSLSVGCLVGDAVLHLIPEILIGDEEEVSVRVSETLTKQCALLASIHGFFLLELMLCLLKTNSPDKDSYEMTNDTTEDQEEQEEQENKSLVWMVVIGDAIHNFADGLAIGAAFSKNRTIGFSTSIAVFCHELPHELGDFAALISTGMSIKKAMFWNFISSLTAFAGLYIGIVASSNEVARSWIFSAGAGMFIYVALSNLVPEVQSYLRKIPNLCMFLSLNIGLLLGYVSMLLLAIFENDIKIV